ncbi:hypothetical protein CesoFtcFv8_019420 [Champsocephalus esox]|uniref:Uncharacterized protein n=1 Tax=Champsocephalus esox TaxID=159716 RepID=A0AAN8BEI2_9TELE|nr:hypothetical protein CesoFtcFv8_019420 [Champsocephalus esox]
MSQRPGTCRQVLTVCEVLHDLIRLRYPAPHSTMEDLEEQHLSVIPLPGLPGPLLYLEGWFGAIPKGDAVLIPTEQ